MDKEIIKFNFVSNGWVNQARSILEDLVSKHGKEGFNFSVCETFTNTPKKIDGSGRVSWHFYIKGKTVKVDKGRVRDTDVKIHYDYQKASVIAKKVYIKEIIKNQEEFRKNIELQEKKGGNLKVPPFYLNELHNRLALLTY